MNGTQFVQAGGISGVFFWSILASKLEWYLMKEANKPICSRQRYSDPKGQIVHVVSFPGFWFGDLDRNLE
jgi:hypothetical protein